MKHQIKTQEISVINLRECSQKALYSIKYMHGSFNAQGWLILSGCIVLDGLPDTLKIAERLNLHDCTGLKSLPDGLKIGGNLHLNRCTGLSSLPDGLTVGGNLYLNDCTGLKSLPNGLSVAGDLNLSGCANIKTLQKDLRVGGYIKYDESTGFYDHIYEPGVVEYLMNGGRFQKVMRYDIN